MVVFGNGFWLGVGRPWGLSFGVFGHLEPRPGVNLALGHVLDFERKREVRAAVATAKGVHVLPSNAEPCCCLVA